MITNDPIDAEDLSPEAAQAQLETLRKQEGRAFNPGQHEALYKAAFPNPTASEETESLLLAAPERPSASSFAQRENLARIKAIRESPEYAKLGTVEHRRLHQELIELYQDSYPNQPTEDEGEFVEPEFQLPDLGEAGASWDPPSLARTYDSLEQLGVNRSVINQWTQRGLDMLAGTYESLDDKKAAAEYRRRWGSNADRVVDDARRVIRWVGSPGLMRFLDQTGLGNDADLIGHLAKYAGRLPGGGAPQAPPRMGSREALRAYQRIHGYRR
jgi:hypothetical protein